MLELKNIYAARDRIASFIHRTPIFASEQLSKRTGQQVYFKGEHLQKTGSFKIRGATNKILQVQEEGAQLVTAASSGNHGQAVAYIANRLGLQSIIAVPEDANPSKVSAIQAYGGKVEFFGTTSAERLPAAQDLAAGNNGVYIPPYDDPFILAGQGTVGLEILEQLPDTDVIVVPIGGGGLSSGILRAVKEVKPSVRVIGVEPAAANDTYLSVQAGEITPISQANTIADGLRASQPGDLTFPLIQKYIDDVVLVEEHEIREACAFMLERTKQLVEPSGAVTVAALLFNKIQIQNEKVVCVLSGGNADIRQISSIIKQ